MGRGRRSSVAIDPCFLFPSGIGAKPAVFSYLISQVPNFSEIIGLMKVWDVFKDDARGDRPLILSVSSSQAR